MAVRTGAQFLCAGLPRRQPLRLRGASSSWSTTRPTWGFLLSGIALTMIHTVGEPSGIEVGFWGTIQKFAIAGARHRGTEKHREQVESSFADYRQWLAGDMGTAAL